MKYPLSWFDILSSPLNKHLPYILSPLSPPNPPLIQIYPILLLHVKTSMDPAFSFHTIQKSNIFLILILSSSSSHPHPPSSSFTLIILPHHPSSSSILVIHPHPLVLIFSSSYFRPHPLILSSSSSNPHPLILILSSSSSCPNPIILILRPHPSSSSSHPVFPYSIIHWLKIEINPVKYESDENQD